MKYLNYEKYKELCNKFSGVHWNASAEARWNYHSIAIQWLKELPVNNPKKILEIGTMGIGLVESSIRLDYEASLNNKDWEIDDEMLSVVHDCRNYPWPFEDYSFDICIALRVFHHLKPQQQNAFEELKRIAKFGLIVVPEKDIHPRGINYEDFVEWNNGKKPLKYFRLEKDRGSLFLFENN